MILKSTKPETQEAHNIEGDMQVNGCLQQSVIVYICCL